LRRGRLKASLTGALAILALALPATAVASGNLYTNNYMDKQVAVFSIAGDGLLAPIGGSPFAVPNFPSGLGITPDGRMLITTFLYAQSIGSYSLAADGAPSPIGSPLPADVIGIPAISPDGRFAYAQLGTGGVAAFAIAADGSLARVGGTFGSGNSWMAALTPDGRFLFQPANKSIERFSVQADGTLLSLGTTPTGSKSPLGIRVTPDGRFALIHVDDGFGDSAFQTYAIGADGSLSFTGSSVTPVGTSNELPVISPSGRFAYGPNSNEDSISTYSIGVDGTVSQVGEPVPAGFERPDGLAMSADGRFLYAVPQQGEIVQAFSVAADGTLTKIGVPAPSGGESDGQTPVARPAVPVAGTLTAGPATPGKKASLEVSGSSDVGATINSYSWDFGDGTTSTTTVPKAQHTFKTGVFDVKVTVRDDANCTGFVYTGQTAYCNANGAQASVKVDTLPVIQGMTATPKRFATLARARSATASAKAKRRRGGTTFHYKLTETARVSVAIQRKLSGRKVGKACKRPTKANAKKRKCVRLKTLGSLVARGKAGKNKLRFSGKLRGKPLPPGRYLAKAAAVDSAGGKSAPRSTPFQVLPAR
jgi:6-phosphogluconolactonase (cycloisomerase 2 family)